MNYFKILKTLDELYTKLLNQTLTVEDIALKIEDSLPFSEIVFTVNKTIGIVDKNFIVSGEYDPEVDEEGHKCIEIELQFPRQPEQFTFSEDDLSRKHWQNFAIDIASVLGHEYMHLNQARARIFEEGKEFNSDIDDTTLRGYQEYYGMEDEIDAYAFTLAASLANDLPNLKSIETAPVYGIYKKVFGDDHEVVKKLENKSKKYLKILELQYSDITNKPDSESE